MSARPAAAAASGPAVQYQSEAALTSELQALTPAEALRLSPTDIISLYLRRQRLAFMASRERHSSVLDLASPPPSASVLASTGAAPTHVLVLGDDGAAARGAAVGIREDGKRCLVAMLRGDGPPSGRDDDVFELSDASEQPPPPLLVLAPSLAEQDRALCNELLLWCDVVIGCYDEAHPESFRALADRWLPLRAQAMAQLQRETRAVVDDHHRDGRLAVNGWLPSEQSQGSPPLILVGLRDAGDATATGGVTMAATHRVNRAQAEVLAEREGAVRLVELYAHNTGQAAILAKHCVMAREQMYEDFPLTARASFLDAKHAALRLLLKAPPPRVWTQTLSPDNRHVLIDLGRSRPSASGLRLWVEKPYEEEGGAVMLTDHRLSLPLGGGSRRLLYSSGRCLFPSDAVEVAAPLLSAIPAGFFDPHRLCFLCSSGGASGTRYTLHRGEGGDAEAWEAPPGSGRVSVLPSSRPADDSVLGRPWPDEIEAAPTSLTVTVASFPSGLSRTFPVPRVLPTPSIAWDADTGAICLSPFPPPPYVELRYTLDGTQPTMASPVYTEPIPLRGLESARVVRAAAFPKAYFASREAVLDLDEYHHHRAPTTATSLPTTASSSASRARRLPPTSSALPATTRAQQLRQAFHHGEYTPPYVPFRRGKREPAEAAPKEESTAAPPVRHRPWSASETALRSRGFNGRDAAASRREAAARLADSHSEGSATSASREADAQKTPPRIITLDPFDPPRCISHVVITLSPSAVLSPPDAAVSYRLEGYHPHGTQYVTLAWGELDSASSGPQVVFLPREMERFPVQTLRCILQSREGGATLDGSVDIAPHGLPVA